MTDDRTGKLNKLKALLHHYEKIAVACSGGVDSTFLLKVACDELGDGALGLTVQSPTVTEDDLKDVQAFYRASGVPFAIVRLNQLDTPSFRHNSPTRCYVCKTIEFTSMAKEAQKRGFKWIAAGINADDAGDYRPGLRALDEIGVVSPLKEAGLSKSDIRYFSRQYHLKTWNKPASSCLASRIQYGEHITQEKLDKISAAEKVLKSYHLKHVRVRYHHGNIARIEVGPEERQFFFSTEVMDDVAEKFKKIGFSYTTLDLSGYRSGSMNEVLDEKIKNRVKMSGYGSR